MLGQLALNGKHGGSNINVLIPQRFGKSPECVVSGWFFALQSLDLNLSQTKMYLVLIKSKRVPQLSETKLPGCRAGGDTYAHEHQKVRS